MRYGLIILFLISEFICYAQNGRGVQTLSLRQDQNGESISAFRNDSELILTQNIKNDIRPYIHPIIAPDGKGILTEFSPEHHKHQTGLYWGLKKVNGRDYFMNWKGDYWRRVSADVIRANGPDVRWRLIYDLLDESGAPILRETQTWILKSTGDKLLLDVEWHGEANVDVTMEKFYVGGLFLRMPWYKGIDGEIINADGKKNNEAEGQRSIWADIGIHIDGREDKAHMAILDHPGNAGSPTAWRVDNELGLGPSRQILGDWNIKKGSSEIIRYRIVIYTGDLDKEMINRLWKEYSNE